MRLATRELKFEPNCSHSTSQNYQQKDLGGFPAFCQESKARGKARIIIFFTLPHI